ncbi:MAG: nucleoside kinase [Candidatus Cloacimonetes bacterium]|nr:nucleoside kinase [Candidatus Cloacimonadota bacterium]
MKIKIKKDNEIIEEITEKKGITPLEIKDKYQITVDYILTAVKVNNNLQELTCPLKDDCTLEFIDTSNRLGLLIYKDSLSLVFIRAAHEIFQDVKVEIKHSISDGYYCEVYSRFLITEKDVNKLQEKMQEMVEADDPIEGKLMNIIDAKNTFRKKDDKIKLDLLSHYEREQILVYKYGEFYEISSVPLVPSAGFLTSFDLNYLPPGIILRFPSASEPDRIATYKHQPNLFRIFTEYSRWGNILDLSYVSSLNKKVDSYEINETILISEALHENKISKIASQIYEHSQKKKLVLVSGPSSSGKTTFSKRLAIQLKAEGLSSLKLSLDDYFVDRENTPKNEEGEYDFESIEAIDKELVNEHIQRLLAHETVEVPKFNFLKGIREAKGHWEKLPEDGILIVEGIHGLNSKLTSSVAVENKFRIYVSALTQLNLDNHNRIPTSDTRIIRRIVRDSFFRGYSAEETLRRWDSIRQGERKYVFKFQEESDAMFNSALVYELGVLKKYAIPALKKVSEESEQYPSALRLIKFLEFFRTVPENIIPKTSIIREFISGSAFNY